MALFVRKKWHYDLRWLATNNVVLYELETRRNIQENERHWKVQLLMFLNGHCSILTKLQNPTLLPFTQEL